MMKLTSTGFFAVLSGHSGCHTRFLAGAVGSLYLGGRDAPRRTQAFQPHAVTCKFSMPTLIKKPSTQIPNTMCPIFNHVNMRGPKYMRCRHEAKLLARVSYLMSKMVLSRLVARPLRPFTIAHAATLDHNCKLIPCDVRLKPLWFQKKGLLQKSCADILALGTSGQEGY